jgi:hypothetical protein
MEADKESVAVDISDDDLFKLMLMAHEQDITLNQLVSNLLLKEVNKLEELDKLDKLARDPNFSIIS